MEFAFRSGSKNCHLSITRFSLLITCLTIYFHLSLPASLGQVPTESCQCQCGCPVTLHFNGSCSEQNGCLCNAGYQPEAFGCRKVVTPSVILGRKRASNKGQVGANVTVICIPSDRGQGAYRWSVDGTLVNGATTSTFIFSLASGLQYIRCGFQQYSRDVESEPLQMIGYERKLDYLFGVTTWVEGIPRRALNDTAINLICANTAWTKRSFRYTWRIGDYRFPLFQRRGSDLFELQNFQISTQNYRSPIYCFTRSWQERRLPYELETDVPAIFVEEGNRYALTGQSVSLTCGFQGHPFPKTSSYIKWSWFFNNVLQPGLITPDIVLTNVSKAAHEGEWKCRAQYRDKAPKDSPVASLFLDLNLTAAIAIDRTLSIDPTTRLAIRCQSSFQFDTSKTYSWTRNGDVLEGYTDDILFVGRHDVGDYICTVKVDLLMATSYFFNLDASEFFAVISTDIPAPVIELVGAAPATRLHPNETYNVMCKVSSNCVEIEFFRDGVPVMKNFSPNFTVITDVINREYSCRALSCGLVSLTSDVVTAEFEVIKSIEIIERKTRSIMLTRISLDCDVLLYDEIYDQVSEEDIRYTWYDEDGVVLSISRSIELKVTDTLITTYRCEAQIVDEIKIAEISVEEKVKEMVPNSPSQCDCRCPKTLYCKGNCDEIQGSRCNVEYQLHDFGCRKEPLIPKVILGRKGATNKGEIDAEVSVLCIPSDLGEGAYRWTVTVNGISKDGGNSSTYRFKLARGAQDIRCKYRQYGREIESQPLQMIGSNGLGSLTWVEGIPNTAVNNTYVDLTCANRHWTKNPVNFLWLTINPNVDIGLDFFAKGPDLYALRFKITTEKKGFTIGCYRAKYDERFLPKMLDADIPDILIKEGNRFAQTGQSVALTCGFQGNPYPKTSPDITWSWRFKGVVQPDLNTPDIVLTDVTKAGHAGAWTCVAQFKGQNAKESGPVSLSIDFPLSATIVVIKPACVLVNVSVAIQCQTSFHIDTTTTVAYSWTRNGDVLEGYTDEILFVGRHDVGNYSCTVQVDLLMATSDPFHLDASEFFPDIPAPVIELEGGANETRLNFTETYVMTCKVFSPSKWTSYCLNIEFLRDGVPVMKSPSQYFTVVSDVINRGYSCRAVNCGFTSPTSNMVTAEFEVIESIEIKRRRQIAFCDQLLCIINTLNCDVSLYDTVPTKNLNYKWYNEAGRTVATSKEFLLEVTGQLNATFTCEAQIGNHTRYSSISVQEDLLGIISIGMEVAFPDLRTFQRTTVNCDVNFEDNILVQDVSFDSYAKGHMIVSSTSSNFAQTGTYHCISKLGLYAESESDNIQDTDLELEPHGSIFLVCDYTFSGDDSNQNSLTCHSLDEGALENRRVNLTLNYVGNGGSDKTYKCQVQIVGHHSQSSSCQVMTHL